MSTIAKFLLSFGIVAALPLPALAHHSDKMFDQDTIITLKGVVKEFQYTNPHSWLLVDVENDDGTVTTWGFETVPPSALMRAGIRPVDLAPGTGVTVSGNPMRDGRPAAELAVVTRDDGTEFHPGLGFQVR